MYRRSQLTIKKKEINNLFSKEISTCKIINEKKKGQPFFVELISDKFHLNLQYLPITIYLIETI